MNSQVAKLDAVSWSGFVIFAMSSVIFPICLPEITKSIPTSLSESGAIETARNFVILSILILATLFASLWGKKIFIAQGQFLIAVGLLLVSYSESYFVLVLSLMIMGLGGGLTEAFLNPLIVDIHPSNPSKYLNLSNAFYPMGIMCSSIIFGELLTLGYSWRFIFRIAAFVALSVAFMFSILNFPKSDYLKKNKDKTISIIFSKGIFWLFAAAIFFGGGIESALTFWSRSFVEEYLSHIPRAGALGVMIFAMAMFIGRLITAQLTIRFNLNIILISSTILGIVVGILIPFAKNLLEFYSLIALAGLATACFWPTILAEAKKTYTLNSAEHFWNLYFIAYGWQ